MAGPILRRVTVYIAGLWAGLLLGIGLIGAPAIFATTIREIAGRSAGRMFAQEAYLSLVLASMMLLILRHQARTVSGDRVASVFNANILLVLGVLFCTVLGYFGLQPMMEEAKAGQQGVLPFVALHGVSVGLFGLKTLLVLILAWRLTARG